MAGALYIWIMAAFFIGCVGVLVLLTGIFWIGHKLEKRQTGATHGFLEVPPEARGRAASSDTLEPPPEAERVARAALKGRTCIHYEKRMLLLVVVTSAIVDDWGVKFDLQVVPAPGFLAFDRTTFTIDCCWDYVTLKDRRISAAYAGWTLMFSPDRVEQIKSLAVEIPDSRELVEKVGAMNRQDDGA